MGYGTYELTGGLHRGEMGGYSIVTTCDEAGCNEEIHRGLAYLCGSDPGGDERGCGGYFCGEHLTADNQCEECEKANPRWTSIADEFPEVGYVWLANEDSTEVWFGVVSERRGTPVIDTGGGEYLRSDEAVDMPHMWWTEAPEPPEFVNWWDR